MIRDFFISVALAAVVAAVLYLCTGCEPDTYVIKDVTVEVIDTMYLHDVAEGLAGICAICTDGVLDTVLVIPSFEACVAAVQQTEAGKICAYGQFWKE